MPADATASQPPVSTTPLLLSEDISIVNAQADSEPVASNFSTSRSTLFVPAVFIPAVVPDGAAPSDVTELELQSNSVHENSAISATATHLAQLQLAPWAAVDGYFAALDSRANLQSHSRQVHNSPADASDDALADFGSESLLTRLG
ncbi:MAG TPA: hypothetical protein VFE46_06925 [Pirellulales bacterium]|nr:hypothetical protein [Pirellulales bacterium]